MSEQTRDGDSRERRQVGDWAYAAMITVTAVAGVVLFLGALFLVAVLVKGWPQ